MYLFLIFLWFNFLLWLFFWQAPSDLNILASFAGDHAASVHIDLLCRFRFVKLFTDLLAFFHELFVVIDQFIIQSR